MATVRKFNENHDAHGQFTSSADRFIDLTQHPLPGTKGHAELNLMPGMEPKQRVEDVPLAEIHTTQQLVDMQKVQKMLEAQRAGTMKPGSDPIVIEMAGTKYLLDGHHRLAMEALNGSKALRSRVVWFAPRGTDSKGKLVVQKSDSPDQRLVYGEVYAPSRPDVDGEYMGEDDIQLMAHSFMRNLRQKYVDVQHDNQLIPGCTVVESFIAREGDPDFIPGSWVVCVHVDDDATWAKVKSGELNGFSVEANVIKVDGDVEIEIPEEGVNGTTLPTDGHHHKFNVVYGPDGKFRGGSTDVVDGHSHKIAAGTITEVANGHRHRFSSVDNLRVTAPKTP